MFSPRNILQGSFSVSYQFSQSDTPDGIRAKYIEGSTGQQKTVDAVVTGDAGNNLAEIDMFGITSRDQAYRTAWYMALDNKYRRKVIRFATEMEGFIPIPGDRIAISTDVMNWGQYGDVVSHSDLALQTSEPLTYGSGTHYIARS